jgi:starvation-inducible outer membrane lipoprotein
MILDTDRELLLHRLKQPEGDEELEYALDRLRKNFYQLWKPIREYQNEPEVLAEWEEAPRHSLERAKALMFEEGLRVLDAAMYG